MHRNVALCVCVYEVCPEGAQTCNMKNRDIYCRRYKAQETLYTEQWRLSPLQSGHLGTSHSSPNRHQLLPLYFPEAHWGFEISSLSKGILVLRKARSHRVPNLGCRGTELLGWFEVLPKKLSTRHDAWADTLSRWSCQSPVAHSCSLLNHPNSFHGGMFKLNAKFDTDSLLYSLRHFECDGHTVHVLTQWRLPPH